MQAHSEISVLHLTNDRLNCSGLLLLSTILVACWAYRHLSLSVRRKITVNVFYSTFTNVYLFLSRFLKFFYFWGNVFFIYVLNDTCDYGPCSRTVCSRPWTRVVCTGFYYRRRNGVPIPNPTANKNGHPNKSRWAKNRVNNTIQCDTIRIRYEKTIFSCAQKLTGRHIACSAARNQIKQKE